MICFSWLFSFHVSFIFFIDHIKKKTRRRPSWGRGIIRKKKSYKKGTEEEDEPGAEVEVTTGPSDSCLTQDEESSCDTSGPRTNGHLPSTEEESSNEPPDAAEAQTLNADEQLRDLASKEEPLPKECEDNETPRLLHCLGDDSQPEVKGDNQEKQVDPPCLNEMSASSDTKTQTKHTDSFLVSQMDCVNGSESMDSMDSQTLKGSSEAVKSTSQSEGSKNTPELDEHNATIETQEHLPQDGTETAENAEDGQDKEGIKLNDVNAICIYLIWGPSR